MFRNAIAALFVESDGIYSKMAHVDLWDKARDARLYEGPHAVVAHPPCERWGQFWFGGTHPGSKRYALGDDGGCFASALRSVRLYGGVLEHPANSHAWATFGLKAPPADGSWVAADWPEFDGWTCCVDQGAYGHLARKTTWLYAHGVDAPDLPSLQWGRAAGEFAHLRATSAARRAARGMDTQPEVLERRICAATPAEFSYLLMSIADLARPAERADRERIIAAHTNGLKPADGTQLHDGVKHDG